MESNPSSPFYKQGVPPTASETFAEMLAETQKAHAEALSEIEAAASLADEAAASAQAQATLATNSAGEAADSAAAAALAESNAAGSASSAASFASSASTSATTAANKASEAAASATVATTKASEAAGYASDAAASATSAANSASAAAASATAAANSAAQAATFEPSKYVAKAGDTMGGNLTISKATPALILDTPEVSTRYIDFRTNGSIRWRIQAFNEAEEGGNKGSSFYLSRYSDSGASLGNVLRVERDTGLVTFLGTAIPRVPATNPTNDNEVTRKAYVDAQRDTRVAKSGDTMSGALTAPRYNLDTNAYFTFNAQGNPVLNFDAVDYMVYNRSTDTLSLNVGGTISQQWTPNGITFYNPVTLPNSDPTNSNHAARKAYVDAQVGAKVSKSGDTMTGALRVQNGSGAATGIVYLGSGNTFLTFDGTNMVAGCNNGNLVVNTGGDWYPVWHSGNLNPGNYMPVGGGSFTGGVSTAAINCGTGQNDSSTVLTVNNGDGVGDGGVAAVAFNCRGLFATKMYLRHDGIFGIGGWTAAPWRWYVNCATGDMTAAGNVIAYSDPRLKDDIQPIEDALDKVEKLAGITFTWNGRSTLIGAPGKRDAGVLADQVAAVLPEAVGESMEDPETGERFKMVAYDKLVPLLIEAIKELKARVEELEAARG